jgi:hypothetical protein
MVEVTTRGASTPMKLDGTDVYSYSTIKMYEECPHAFHRKKILCEEGEPNWFAELGSLVHQIHEDYHNVGKDKELPLKTIRKVCLAKFDAGFFAIKSVPPFQNIAEIRYKQIVKYFSNFVPDKEITKVEEHLEWVLNNGRKMRGYLDEQTQTTNPNHKAIGDIKSSYKEDYDRQLATYCIAHKAVYGKYPQSVYVREYTTGNKVIFKVDTKWKTNILVAEAWLEETIEKIEKEKFWKPKGNSFLCNSLCDYRNSCKFKIN